MSIMKVLIIFFILFGSSFGEISTNINNEQDKVIDLTQEDFSVSDGVDTIILDTLNAEMVLHRELITDETNPMYHFVGEIYDGDYVYKFWAFQYDGIRITVSNLDYEKKERKEYIYYISQIDVTDTTFSTSRGISVGASKKEVIEMYGKGELLIENDYICCVYTYEDKRILFKFDEENRVKEIRFIVYKQ